MKPAPKLVPPGNSREKVVKETPQDSLMKYNLKTSLATCVDKACGNTIGAIVERFIKPRASTMFGHAVYYLDGTGPSISVPIPHEVFFQQCFCFMDRRKVFFM